jgi:hypothetical protein
MFRTLLVVVSAVVMAGGCARQAPEVSAAPSLDELPDLKELRRKPHALEIHVPGTWDVPRYNLVPEIKEPELTAKERAALGEDRITHKFLPHPDPYPTARDFLGTFAGGVETLDRGRSGPGSTNYVQVPTMSRRGGGEYARDTYGYSTVVPPPGEAYGPRHPAGAAGPPARVRVGVGGEARMSAAERDDLR